MQKYIYLMVFFYTSVLSLIAEEITHYDIEIKIQKSGELLIKERIEYDFKLKNKHGMFRDIPMTIKVGVHTIDLGFSNYSVTMDGKNIPWKKSMIHSSKVGDTVRLKIGSSSSTVTGKHLYEIKYLVKMGVLVSAEDASKDAVRWNIIGTGWEIPLSNIKAKFILPEDISRQNVSIKTYTGIYGSTTTRAKTQWNKARELEVTIEDLKMYEGATVELSYPANTLGQSGQVNMTMTTKDKFMAYWHWGALLGILLYFWRLLRLYSGFEDKRAIAVQYNPPASLSLLQSGLLLDKIADNKDFSGAILELGYLGYLKIEQKTKESIAILTRIDKEIQNLTEDQKYLLEHTLFGESQSFVLEARVKDKANALQSDFLDINGLLYHWSVRNGYMSENPKILRKKFLKKSTLVLLPVLALVAYGLFSKMGEVALFMLIFPLVFGSAGMTVILSSKFWGLRFFGLLFLVVGLLPLWIFGEEGMTLQSLIFGPVGVLFVLIIATMVIYKKIGRFTQKGAYHYTHLLGLKMYIERVKEDEIKRNLERDPFHLEKLLPYAVLFGTSKHWLSFYERLNLSSPAWYDGSSYNIEHFSSSLSRASTPPVESSGGSGFSGGGSSSGGGGGGGGGGSW